MVLAPCVLDEDPAATPLVSPPIPDAANHRSLNFLYCPFCSGFSTRAGARGLILHITRRHMGETIGNEGPAFSILWKEGCVPMMDASVSGL